MEHLTDFTIGHNAKIFNLLSKHLYSDPLTAAVRECGTNAIDAQRENGLDPRHQPIEIRVLHNWAERNFNTISFTDNGPGITPDRMSMFVSSLGSSSKTSDANQNGTFGIGLLSVFNVSAQLTIDSVVRVGLDLVRYQYIVFLDETGIPTCTQVLERASEAGETGVRLSFPVPKVSIDKLRETVRQVWATSPAVTIVDEIDGKVLTFKPPGPEERRTLVAGAGFSLVGRGNLLEVVDNLAVVVECGDVVYPFFCKRTPLFLRVEDEYLTDIGAIRHLTPRRRLSPSRRLAVHLSLDRSISRHHSYSGDRG